MKNSGAKCHFCDRPFRNQQAVRAHLRHCAAYSAESRLGTQPIIGKRRDEAPKGISDARVSARQWSDPKRKNQASSLAQLRPPQRVRGVANEGLEYLFDIRERLRYLREEAINFLWYMRLTACCLRPEGHAGYAEWLELFRELDRWYDVAKHTVERCGLDYKGLYDMYEGITSIKERWLRYRKQMITESASRGDYHEDVTQADEREALKEGIAEEEARFNALLGKIKALLASL